MLRIPVTSSDFESGRIKKAIALLRNRNRNRNPDGKMFLSDAQERFAVLIGYGKYGDLFSSAKAYGPVYQGLPLQLPQVIEAVGQRIAQLWNIPAAEANTLAVNLRLGNLDACRVTARTLPPSTLRHDRLSPAVRVATHGFTALSTARLKELGAPGFSYVTSNNGDTFIWDNLVNAVEQLRPDHLDSLKSLPKYASITDLSELRDAYVRDVLIPASHKPLLDAVRQKELVPPGYEIISLFNEAGEFRGRSLINRKIRGLVPVISRDDGGLCEAMAALLGGRAPAHSGIIRNVKPGDGKGRLISFNTEGGGFVVHDHVENVPTRHPDRTYVEYEGAEQMFELAPDATHHENEISRLIASGLADLVKMSQVDLVPIKGLVLDDGRFPGDIMDIQPGPITVDGQFCPRSAASDWLSGPSFYERQIRFIRLHDWLTVDDIPQTVLSSMDIPNTKSEIDHMLTDALPQYRLDLHHQLDNSVPAAINQAQLMIASTAGTQKVLDLVQQYLSPEQAYVRIVQVITPVVVQRVSDQKLIAAGQLTKEAMPELEAYRDYVVGVALAMSSDEYSLNVPGIRDYRAKANLLSWLAIFSVRTANDGRKTARFSSPARAVLLSAVLKGGLSVEDLLDEGNALMAFLSKLADEDRYIFEIHQWRDEAARRWSAARKLGYWAVGAVVQDASSEPIDSQVSDTSTTKLTHVIRQEAENHYRVDILS